MTSAAVPDRGTDASSADAQSESGNREWVRPAGLVRPPALRTTDDRSSSRLELFFDLAFILVVAELATDLADDTNGYGIGQFAGLFAVMWTAWVGFTLYANRFDTDDVVFRVAKLIATGAIAGCAAAATGATSEQITAFTVCYLASRLILLGLYLRALRHVPQARVTITAYLSAAAATAALWAVSLAVPAPARFWLWAAAVAIDVVAPLVVSRIGDTAPLHPEHLPDRFALFVILSLGEVITAGVAAVHDAHWKSTPVLITALGFVVAGALWWAYFDLAAETPDQGEGDPDDDRADEQGTGRHDRFVYGHLPLTGGVIAAGAAFEHLALHPTEPTGTAALILCGGLAIAVTGLAFVTAGTARAWAAAWPWPIVAVPVLLAVPALHLPAMALTATVAVVTLVLAAAAGPWLVHVLDVDRSLGAPSQLPPPLYER